MKNYILPASILSASFVLCAVIGAATFNNALALKRTVIVKGLAEQQIEANVALWELPFHVSSSSLTETRKKAEKHQQLILDYLTYQGIKAEEILVRPISIKKQRENIGHNQWRNTFMAQARIRIRTTNLNIMEQVVSHTDTLLSQDILLGQSYGDIPLPQYIFTNLNDIKPKLIETATQNARASAEQFATDSGSTIGGIAKANQGIISILSRDGDYGERQERFKKVRVVSTIEYFLKN